MRQADVGGALGACEADGSGALGVCESGKAVGCSACAPRVVDAVAPGCKVNAEAGAADDKTGHAAEETAAGGGGAAAQLETERQQLHDGGDRHSPACFHYLEQRGGERLV